MAPIAETAHGILNPQGPVGAADRMIMFNALEIMLAIVVPTLVTLLVFAWWFRAGNARARHAPGFVYSGTLELVVWSVPLLVIMFLGGVMWIGSHRLDPRQALPAAAGMAAEPIEIDVVSLDWKWLFIYPQQGIASLNALTVPRGVPVHFMLTSASVMNGFFIPQLGSMIATMPGMVTQLWLRADQAGTYYGESAQFSGDGFSGMRFTLDAVSDADFTAWVAAARRQGTVLGRDEYASLARQSSDLPARAWGGVDGALFQLIATEALPAAPGPGG